MSNAERPSDELVERMISLVRLVAQRRPFATTLGFDGNDEAGAIVTELPKPIDPDLIEARKIAADLIRHNSPYMVQDIESGHGDHYSPVLQVAAGIKRGRALAKEEAGL